MYIENTKKTFILSLGVCAIISSNALQEHIKKNNKNDCLLVDDELGDDDDFLVVVGFFLS